MTICLFFDIRASNSFDRCSTLLLKKQKEDSAISLVFVFKKSNSSAEGT